MFTMNSTNLSFSLVYIFFQFATVNRNSLISKIRMEEREVIYRDLFFFLIFLQWCAHRQNSVSLFKREKTNDPKSLKCR